MPILINGPIFFERFVGIITEYFERLLSFIIFGLKSWEPTLTSQIFGSRISIFSNQNLPL